jgi:MFS family permease
MTMDVIKSPDLTTAEEREKKEQHLEADAEIIGTIIIAEDSTDRQALRPQPSLDPNDPLNWPTSQKYITYLSICFFTFLATVNSSKFTVAIVPLSKEFHVSTTHVGYQVCFSVLLLGSGNIFWVPLMRCIGKRPVYLLSLPLLVAMNVWSSKTHSFNSLLAASILSGFAASAGDATVPAVAADLFFVHQRGAVMMIFHMALSCGVFLGPLINAYTVQYSSWRVSCEWIAIAAGILWVIAIFTVHETTYYQRDVNAPASAFGPKKSFKQKMGITSGYNKDLSYLKALGSTVAVIAYPPVLWSGLTVGTFVGWSIVIQLTAATHFTKPPYSYPISFLGLFSLSGLIGAFLATFFGGPLIDLIANRLTRLHHGRREPEYRLYAILIPGIIGPFGILIFGLTLAEKKPWIQPAVGCAMGAFGLTAVSNVVVTYAVDSYLPLAGEALVLVFVIRGVTGTVLALYSVDWITRIGMKSAFYEMVGIQYFFILWVVVFVIWGKRIRARTAEYGPMAWRGHRH